MPGTTTVHSLPADHWYAVYEFDAEPPGPDGETHLDTHFTPLVGFVVLYDPVGNPNLSALDFVPLAWDRIAKKIIDARTLPRFKGLGRSYKIEPHFLATEKMLTAALEAPGGMSKADIAGVVNESSVVNMANMIADKKVARTLTALGLLTPSP